MNDMIDRIRTIQDLCVVVEGELVESGHPLFAGKAAALYELAAALERSLARLGEDDGPVSSTAWVYEDGEWHGAD